MKARLTAGSLGVAAMLATTSVHANNDASTTYRAGTISAPSVGNSTSNPSAVSVNQGRASYSIPIEAPPGKSGIAPSLALTYHGRMQEGVLGSGWDLSIPSVRVRTNGRGGQPNYGVAVRYLGIDGEELVEIAADLDDQDGDGLRETLYRPERDTGYRRYVELSAGGWRVDNPDGTKLTLGTTTASQVLRAGGVDDVSQWLPESLEDTSGNQLLWMWSDADEVATAVGNSAVNDVARYLSEMRWGCQDCTNATTYQSLSLEYEELPIHALDFSPGYLVEWEFGLASVETASVVAGAVTPVRNYDLDYDVTDTRRVLASVTLEGADGSALPPVSFRYTDRDEPATPSGVTGSPGSGFGSGVVPLDVDLDGSPDFVDLSNVAAGGDYRRRTGVDGVTFGPSTAFDRSDLPGVSLVAGGDASAEDTTRDLAIDVFDLNSGSIYAHNQAGGWTYEGDATLPVIASNADTVRIDLNADGYVDLLDTGVSPWVGWLDDGSHTYDVDRIDFTADTTPTFGAVLAASDDGVLFGELNGDGLVDCVYVDGLGSAHVFYGRGLGGFGWLLEDGRGLQHSTLSINSVVGSGPAAADARIQDVDGDGLGDLISFDAANAQLRIWRRIPGAGFDEAGTGSPFTQTISATDGCRTADWDIDGVSEILCSDGWNLYDWSNQTPFMLEEVDNGLGLITRIGYATTAKVAAAHEDAGHSWAARVSMALPVVTQTEVDDSRGNVMVTAYDYRDPHYERDEIEDHFELTGFRYIQTEQTPMLETTPGSVGSRINDPQDPGMTVRSFFDVGDVNYQQRGMLDCEETWTTGDTPADTFDCDLAAAGPLARKLHTHSESVDADGIFTTQIDAIDEYTLEGGSPAVGAHNLTEYEYDDYGNRVVQRSYGTDDPGDELMTVTDYIRNTDDWILRAVRKTEHGEMVGSGPAATLVVTSGACNLFDNVGGLCNPGYAGALDDQVDAGLVTRTFAYTDDDLSDGTPGSWATVRRTSYTSLGLPDIVSDPAGVVDHGYDADFGLFKSSESVDPSGLNLRTEFDIDPTHGQATKITDPAGGITRARFDDLGRMTRLAKPKDTLANPTLTRSYDSAAPTSVVTDVQKDGTADGLTTERTIDGAGRLLCERREAPSGFEIVSQQEFTARGLLAMEILPSTQSQCDVISAGPSGRSSTRNHDAMDYDALSRAVELRHEPSGTWVSTAYGVLDVVVSDEEDTDPGSLHVGTPTRRVRDGQGRVTQVIETADNDGDGVSEDYVSTYAYDSTGLLSVTDPLGSTIFEARHDSRGRMVWTRDADRGEQQSVYDNADRLTAVSDDRGHSVAYTYDAASRALTETSDDGVAAEVTTYHYDTHPSGAVATAACWTTGRLAWVEGASGESVLCYDKRGRTRREDTTISAYSATAQVTQRAFDSLDRVTKLGYPDGTELRYRYDGAGRANELEVRSNGASYGFITDATYTAAGQLETIDFGNGVETEIDYDDRLRPTTHRTADGGNGLELNLTLDNLGNVTRIADGVGSRSGDYVYDDWGRLVEASGDILGGETLQYAYDPRGNLLSRSSTDPTSALQIHAFEYTDPTAVHALTGVDRDGDGTTDESFAYDALGNLAEDGAYGFDFDPLGRLRGVEDLAGNNLVEYSYDYLGRRVASEYDSGDATYFVRPAQTEIRDTGGGVVVRKQLTFAGRMVGMFEDDFVAGTEVDHLFIYGLDHLGAPSIVFDVASTPSIIERWASYPYGAENTAVLDDEGNLADYRDPSDPSTLLTHRFQGQEIDGGLPEFYDFGARVYRSDLGRFLSADSIVPDPGAAQSWNRYAFVRNNPMSRIDPTGHADVLATASVGAGSGAGWGNTLDNLQTTLDGASIAMDVTGVGATVSWVPDLANGVISLGRGDYMGAGMSAMAAVPFLGATANAARIARRAKAAKGALAKPAAEAVTATAKAVPARATTNTAADASRVAADAAPSATTGRLPDDAFVVRGGVANEKQIARGISEHRDVPGLVGFSAQSKAGLTVDELAMTGGRGNGPYPNGQISYTTVGELRCIGCDVIPSPGGGANHATVVPGGVSPAAIAETFTQKINPAKER